MNCIILTAIRSGSTYLTRLLWETGLFHYPDPHSLDPSIIPQRALCEFFAPNHNIDPWDVEKKEKTKEDCIAYFRHKTSYKKEEPVLLKVLDEQYKYYMLEDDDRWILEREFPNPKYIWLERRDIIARTISAYLLFATKTPHIQNQAMLKEYQKQSVIFDDEGMLDVYKNHVKKGNWRKFLTGTNYLKIEYEELIANPVETLEKCLDYMNFDKKNVKEIVERVPQFKTERAESKELYNRLRNLLRKTL